MVLAVPATATVVPSDAAIPRVITGSLIPPLGCVKNVARNGLFILKAAVRYPLAENAADALCRTVADDNTPVTLRIGAGFGVCACAAFVSTAAREFMLHRSAWTQKQSPDMFSYQSELTASSPQISFAANSLSIQIDN